MMTTPSPEERIAALEVEMRTLRADQAEMKADIKAIVRTLAEAKGGWRLLLLIIAGAALFGATAHDIANWVLH